MKARIKPASMFSKPKRQRIVKIAEKIAEKLGGELVEYARWRDALAAAARAYAASLLLDHVTDDVKNIAARNLEEAARRPHR